MSSKVQVRQQVRAAMQSSPEARAEKSQRLCAALARDPAWERARTVAIFAPHQGEPDVELLLPFAAGKTLCYPRVNGVDLDFYRVSHPSELVVSRWKLREPEDRPAHAVPLAEMDIILVPGIAFTRGGERLGRGGGFYDRLLSRAPAHALKIGVCFDVQLLAALPSESHDMRVDRVATESGVI